MKVLAIIAAGVAVLLVGTLSGLLGRHTPEAVTSPVEQPGEVPAAVHWIEPSVERAPAIVVDVEQAPEDVRELIRAIGLDRDATARERDAALDAIGRLMELMPNERPYATWLVTTQAASASVPERADVRETLKDFPVLISAREGAWLLERIKRNDWHLYGDGRANATLLYLGPQRVLEEAGDAWAEEARHWYSDEEWTALFGQGAHLSEE